MSPDDHPHVLVADAPARRAGDPPDPDPAGGRARRRVLWELMALVVLLALALLTRWIDGATPQMLPAIQAFGALTVPASAGLVLVGLWAGHRPVALAAGGLALVQLATLVPWWVAGDRAVAPDRGALVVMAGNLQYGRGDPDVVVTAVRRRGVDVLALSEVTPDARDALVAAGITADLPHVVDQAREGPGGGMLLSRHPIATDAAPPVPTLTFATPSGVVDAPGGEALVVAAHPVPPWPGDTERWHSELAALASWAADVGPDIRLVVAGDLNATDAHPVLRRFADAGLRDAHRQLGHGPVATWPRSERFGVPLVPLLHLDHVLSRGFGVADAGRVAIPGSDHDAVWASLAPGRAVSGADPVAAGGAR